MIIDFHVHAFPDAIAGTAIQTLIKGCKLQPFHDGTVRNLLECMDQALITRSVICSIATKPSQFEPILEWSKQIRSERIEPFASIHPDDPESGEKIKIVYNEGFKGIKLHPYYQKFIMDEERLLPLYEYLEEYGLILVIHAGFDEGFPFDRIADPIRIARIIKQFPALKIVVSHFGGYKDWDEVEKHLLGKPVYLEISMALGIMNDEQTKRFFSLHPADYLLFGTDSPWAFSKGYVEQLKTAGLETGLEQKILYKNGLKLLDGL